MRQVKINSEVGDAVNRARTGSTGYCSNFFPSPQKLQSWITHGVLFCDQHDGMAFFFRKDRDFWHLYFCAANPTVLQQAVAAHTMLKNEPVVLDLIGKKPALAEMTAWFEPAGFRIYNHLFRMARTVVTETPLLKTDLDSRVVVASQADSHSILDLLLRSFDSRAEQIPTLYEIETAVAAGQIRVVHDAGMLAGLLYFETQGITSILRYWLIVPGFRAQGLGACLMHRYFAEHPAVRRFLLWVVAANTDAIRKYEHYSFVPEGLVDYVLANDKIRP